MSAVHDTTMTVTDTAAVTPALELRGITAGYGRTVVLRDVNITVPPGQVVALLGPNGAGKTTALRVASGLLRSTLGSVHVDGVDVSRRTPHQRAKLGLCLIPEGRGVFRNLTVADNLRLQVPPWADRGATVDRAVEAFPILGRRLGQLAGSMSGGEQQMLALARALLSSPKVVLFDEVSMGLSPILVDAMFATMRTIAASGVTLLIVEQFVNRALDIADAVVLLDKGGVSFSGPPSALNEESLLRHYLGVDGTGGDAPQIPAVDPA